MTKTYNYTLVNKLTSKPRSGFATREAARTHKRSLSNGKDYSIYSNVHKKVVR